MIRHMAVLTVLFKLGLAWSGAPVVAQEVTELKSIELSPSITTLCVLPADYELPHTRRGFQKRIAQGRYLYRSNSEHGVDLRSDQVLGLSAEDWLSPNSDLAFLKPIPGGQVRSLAVIVNDLSDAGVRALERCTGLKSLTICCKELGDIRKLVEACPALEQFGLESLESGESDLEVGKVFSDETCRHFAGWKELRCVQIGGRGFTDAAVHELVKLPKIEVIAVGGSFKITDNGLKALVAAKQLREIVLHVGPKCTDDGVKELLKLEHLEWIEIHGVQKVEPATLEALKVKFPDAHIEFKPRVSR